MILTLSFLSICRLQARLGPRNAVYFNSQFIVAVVEPFWNELKSFRKKKNAQHSGNDREIKKQKKNQSEETTLENFHTDTNMSQESQEILITVNKSGNGHSSTITEMPLFDESSANLTQFDLSDADSHFEIELMDKFLTVEDGLVTIKESEIKSKMDGYNKKLQEYHNALQHRNEVISQLSTSLQRTIEHRDKLESEAHNRDETIATEIKILKQQLHQATDLLRSQKGKNSISAHEMFEAKSQLILLIETNEAKDKLIEELTQKINDQTIRHSNFEREFDNLKNELARVTEREKEMVATKDQLARELDLRVEELMRTQDLFHGKMSEKDETLEIVKAELVRVKANEESLTRQFETRKAEMEEQYGLHIGDMKSKIQREHEAIVKQLAVQVEELQLRLSEAPSKSDHFDEKMFEILQLKNENEKLKNAQLESGDRADRLLKETHSWKAKLEEVAGQKVELEVELKSLKRSETDYDDKDIDMDMDMDCARRVKLLEAELSETAALKIKCDALECEKSASNEKCMNQINALEKTKLDLELKVCELESRQRSMQKSHCEIKNELLKLEREKCILPLVDYSEEVNVLVRQMSAAENVTVLKFRLLEEEEIARALGDQVAHLTERCERYERRRNEMASELDALQNELRIAWEKHENTLKQLENNAEKKNRFAPDVEMKSVDQDDELRAIEERVLRENAFLKECLEEEKARSQSLIYRLGSSQRLDSDEKLKILMDSNRELLEERDDMLTRIKDQDALLTQMSNVDSQARFEEQLAELNRQQKLLVDKLEQQNENRMRVRDILDERNIFEETLRRDKEELEQNMKEKEEVESQLIRHKVELERLRFEKRHLEELLLHKDQMEKELKRQRRSLEDDLAELEHQLRDREDFIRNEKTQLELEMQKKEVALRKWRTDFEEKQVQFDCLHSSLQASEDDRSLRMRIQLQRDSLHKIEEIRSRMSSHHSLAMNRLRKEIEDEFTVREGRLVASHAVQMAQFCHEKAQQLKLELQSDDLPQAAENCLLVEELARARARAEEKLMEDVDRNEKTCLEDVRQIVEKLSEREIKIVSSEINMEMVRRQQHLRAAWQSELESARLAAQSDKLMELSQLRDNLNKEHKNHVNQIIQTYQSEIDSIRDEKSEQIAQLIGDGQLTSKSLMNQLRREIVKEYEREIRGRPDESGRFLRRVDQAAVLRILRVALTGGVRDEVQHDGHVARQQHHVGHEAQLDVVRAGGRRLLGRNGGVAARRDGQLLAVRIDGVRAPTHHQPDLDEHGGDGAQMDEEEEGEQGDERGRPHVRKVAVVVVPVVPAEPRRHGEQDGLEPGGRDACRDEYQVGAELGRRAGHEQTQVLLQYHHGEVGDAREDAQHQETGRDEIADGEVVEEVVVLAERQDRVRGDQFDGHVVVEEDDQLHGVDEEGDGRQRYRDDEKQLLQQTLKGGEEEEAVRARFTIYLAFPLQFTQTRADKSLATLEDENRDKQSFTQHWESEYLQRLADLRKEIEAKFTEATAPSLSPQDDCWKQTNRASFTSVEKMLDQREELINKVTELRENLEKVQMAETKILKETLQTEFNAVIEIQTEMKRTLRDNCSPMLLIELKKVKEDYEKLQEKYEEITSEEVKVTEEPLRDTDGESERIVYKKTTPLGGAASQVREESSLEKMEESTNGGILEEELTKLQKKLEEKHVADMEQLRVYFEKRCEVMEVKYEEEVAKLKASEQSGGSGGDDKQFLPRMPTLTHFCDTWHAQEPNVMELEEHYTSELDEKLQQYRLQLEEVRKQLESKHEQEIENLKLEARQAAMRDVEAVRTELVAKYRQEIERIASEHEQEIEAIKAKCAQDLAKETTRVRLECTEHLAKEMEAESEKLRDQFESEHAKQAEIMHVRFEAEKAQEINNAVKKLQATLTTNANYEMQRDKLEKLEALQSVASATTCEREHRVAVDALREQCQEEMREVNAKWQDKMDELERSARKQVAEIEGEKDRLQRQHETELDELRSHYEKRLVEEKDKWCEEITADNVDKFEVIAQQLDSDHQSELEMRQSLIREHEEKIEQLQHNIVVKEKEFEVVLAELKESHDSDVHELREEAKRRLAAELKRVRTEMENLNEEKLQAVALDTEALKVELEDVHRKEIIELQKKMSKKHRDEMDVEVSKIINEAEEQKKILEKRLEDEMEKRMQVVKEELEENNRIVLAKVEEECIAAKENELKALRNHFDEEVARATCQLTNTNGFKEPEEEQEQEQVKENLMFVDKFHPRELCLWQPGDTLELQPVDVINRRARENEETDNLIALHQQRLDQLEVERDHLRLKFEGAKHVLSSVVQTYSKIEMIINRQLSAIANTDVSELGSPTKEFNLEDEQLVGDTSYLSFLSEDGFELDLSAKISEMTSCQSELDVCNDEIVASIGTNLQLAVTRLLQILTVTVHSCHESKLAQMELINTAATHGEEAATMSARCADLELQLTAEVENRERLAVEVHKTIGLMENYKTEKSRLEDEVCKQEKARENVVSELLEARARIGEMEGRMAEETTRFNHQRTLISEGLSSHEQGIIQENVQLHTKHQDLQQQSEKERHNLTKRIQELEVELEEQVIQSEQLLENQRQQIEDFQQQVEALEKQLRADKKYFDSQAAEYEQEREELQREVNSLQNNIRDKDRQRGSEDRLSHELESLTILLQAKTDTHEETLQEKTQVEAELGKLVEQMKDWQEILKNLEFQLDEKTRAEMELAEQVKNLENQLKQTSEREEELASELEVFRSTSTSEEMSVHVQFLEDQLELRSRELDKCRNSQNFLQEFRGQIRNLEVKVEKKTRDLEALQLSASSLGSPSSEDLSLRDQLDALRSMQADDNARSESPAWFDEMKRLEEKLEALTRAEEVAIKKTRDLEISLKKRKELQEELLQDKEALQQQVNSQLLQISALQARIEEWRHNIDNTQVVERMARLQECADKDRELLESKDKEIDDLHEQLEQIQSELVSRETEVVRLQLKSHSPKIKDTEWNKINDENTRLKQELKSLQAQFDRISMPAFAQTLLDEKNQEIDHLTQQLEELQTALDEFKCQQSGDGTTQEAEKMVHKMIATEGRMIQTVNEIQELYDILKVAQVVPFKFPSDFRKRDFGALQTILNEKEEKIKRLELLLKAGQEEMSAFQAKNDVVEKEAEFKRIVEVAEQRKREVDSLRGVLKEKETLLEQVETLQGEVTNLTDFQTKLQEDYDTVQSMLEDTQKDLIKLQQQIKANDTNHQLEKSKLQTEVCESSQLLLSKDSEIVSLKERLDLLAKNSAMRHDELGREIAALREQTIGYQDSIEITRYRNEDSNGSPFNLFVTAETPESIAKTCKTSRANGETEVHIELDRKKKEIENLVLEKEELNAKLRALLVKNDDLTKSHDKAVQANKKSVGGPAETKKLQQMVHEMKRQIEDQKMEFSKTSQELHRAKTRQSSLEVELAEIPKLTLQLQQTLGQVENLKTVNSKLELEQRRDRDETSLANELIKKLEVDIERLKRNEPKRELEEKQKTLEANNLVQMSEIERLRDETEQYQQDVDTLHSLLSTEKEEVEKLKEQHKRELGEIQERNKTNVECQTPRSENETLAEYTVPDHMQSLIQKVHKEGVHVLSLSELLLLKSFNSRSPEQISERWTLHQAWENEKQQLMSEIVALKDLLTQATEATASLRTTGQATAELSNLLLQAVSTVFQKEKESMVAELRTHILASNQPTPYDISRLEHRIDAMSENQNLVVLRMQQLLREPDSLAQRDVVRQLTEERMQHLKDKESFLKQITTLENDSTRRERHLKKQIELSEYHMKQKEMLTEDLRMSLEMEKKRTLDLSSQLSYEKGINADLDTALTITKSELAKIQVANDRDKREIKSLTAACESEKFRSQALLQALECEQSNFSQLQEAMEAEKRRCKSSLARHQQIIQELQKSLEVSKNHQVKTVTALDQERFNHGNTRQQLEQIENKTSRILREPRIDESQTQFNRNADLIANLERERQRVVEITNALSSERATAMADLEREQALSHQLNKKLDCALEQNQELKRNLQREIERAAYIETESTQLRNQHAADREREMNKDAEWELKRQLERERQREEEDLELEVQKLTQKIKSLERELEHARQNETQLQKDLQNEQQKISLQFIGNESCPVGTRSSDNSFSRPHDTHLIETAKQQFLCFLFQCQQDLDSFVQQLGVDSTIAQNISRIFKSFTRNIGQIKTDFAPPPESGDDNRLQQFLEQVIRQNDEIVGFVIQLCEDKMELRRMQMSLEEEIVKTRQKLMVAEQALIYQKKYLLVVLGGFQESEATTLAMISQIGVPGTVLESRMPRHQFALMKFRSAARVVVAVSRMKYLVRRWNPQHMTAPPFSNCEIRCPSSTSRPPSASSPDEHFRIHRLGTTPPVRDLRTRSCLSSHSVGERTVSSAKKSLAASISASCGDNKDMLTRLRSDRSLQKYLDRLESIQHNFGNTPTSRSPSSSVGEPICFGNVRVVVPCGNGELLVKDLIEKAVVRYKKATGKPTESWVTVHNLKSFSDDGILDRDDKLRDVADDREQLFAAYDEEGGLPSTLLGPSHSDGLSTASSLGTESPSPDIFKRSGSRCSSRNDVEVNCDTIPSGLTPLHVRRGSEPALNRISPIPSLNSDTMKRWSAAVLGDDDVGPNFSTPKDQSVEKLCEEDEPADENARMTNGLHPPAFQRFSSESGRLSILGNNAETVRWVDAADRQLYRYQSQDELNKESKKTNLVVLRNEDGPLGIHVVPDYDETGKDVGLVVQGIEPGGRIDRDGRLQVQDRIIDINGQCLLNVSFQRAQEVFKDALQAPEIRLRVLKDENDGRVGPKMATVTQTKTSVVSAASRPTSGIVLAANTRKIGKKIHIQLSKGHEGLGFSVTTRDNPAGGNCPIYIKNILPKGAAVQDGRLKPGDRLLEVNGIEMTGKTQSEAVKILRNTPLGGTVKLVVSRQEADSPKLPREMTTGDSDGAKSRETVKCAEDGVIFPFRNRETLTLIIPLNDTESAGLGVSVKGKTSTTSKGTTDLGIFVKSVIKGGAASKVEVFDGSRVFSSAAHEMSRLQDGRLQENDQLLSVNDVDLLGMSNSAAMEALRRAIQQEGPNANAITLIVSRRLVPGANYAALDTDSAASEHSDGTSLIILHPQSLLGADSDERRNLDQRDAAPRKIEDKDLGLDVPTRNPVVDRLTGQRGAPSASNLRNESYYRATHDVSWQKSPQKSKKQLPLQRIGSVAAPTVNLTIDNSIIIEDEYSSPVERSKTKNHLTVYPTDRTDAQGSDSASAYMSQLSLDDAANNFARDGFGRQSMSEKRHAHIDAKNTDTYQRSKKAREDRLKQQSGNTGDFRTNSADSLLNANHKDPEEAKMANIGPILGMKKSSSLESLQTRMAKNYNNEQEGENFVRPSVKAIKGRGCNESFRAAVDRSYDVSKGTEGMETLDEESESGSSGRGRGALWQTKIPGEFAPDEVLRIDPKSPKKKSIFKGFGNVFKFGKPKKTSTSQLPRLTMHDLEKQKVEAEKINARKAAQEEQERIQEQYRKLLQQQQQQQMQNGPIEQEAQNRQHRITQLRAQYQRKQHERQGQQHSAQRYDSEVVHSRSHSYDVYKEIERPGSRKGIADPSKFSHYMNYEEIQQHLIQQKKHEPFFLAQQQQPQHETRRPLKNYYEYEVVQPSFRYINPSESSNSLPRKSHVKSSRNRDGNHVDANFFLRSDPNSDRSVQPNSYHPNQQTQYVSKYHLQIRPKDGKKNAGSKV
uniref:PDZ domain-containing protein n=1 Tax=Strigamia maritima TaxID=126957 RepID=T1JCX4_STRMM